MTRDISDNRRSNLADLTSGSNGNGNSRSANSSDGRHAAGENSSAVASARTSKSAWAAVGDRVIYDRMNDHLSPLGLKVKDMKANGNCMLSALSDQMTGSDEYHAVYRREICNFLLQNRDYYEPFCTSVDYVASVQEMSLPGQALGQEALDAFCKLKNVTILVHQLERDPLQLGSGSRIIHLFYHNGHYLSVRN